jgi:hypothetical protein
MVEVSWYSLPQEWRVLFHKLHRTCHDFTEIHDENHGVSEEKNLERNFMRKYVVVPPTLLVTKVNA